MPRAQYRLVFESFGVLAEVVSDDRGVFDSLPRVLPPGWRPGKGTAGEALVRFGLARDGRVTLDGAEFFHTDGGASDPLLRLGSVMRHHLALHAPAHVFIHAGVVRAGGVTIVIPGSSHSGKTTLVAELVRAGATYYSDEYAVVDSEGLIHPYAKSLSIRSPGRDHVGVPVPVPEAQIATRAARADLIVVTSYEPGARWRPRECARSEGAFALLQNTVAARPRPGAALAAVSQLSRDARVISGPRGEAKDMANALLSQAPSPGSNGHPQVSDLEPAAAIDPPGPKG